MKLLIKFCAILVLVGMSNLTFKIIAILFCLEIKIYIYFDRANRADLTRPSARRNATQIRVRFPVHYLTVRIPFIEKTDGRSTSRMEFTMRTIQLKKWTSSSLPFIWTYICLPPESIAPIKPLIWILRWEPISLTPFFLLPPRSLSCLRRCHTRAINPRRDHVPLLGCEQGSDGQDLAEDLAIRGHFLPFQKYIWISFALRVKLYTVWVEIPLFEFLYSMVGSWI